jgi:hypothetical protein
MSECRRTKVVDRSWMVLFYASFTPYLQHLDLSQYRPPEVIEHELSLLLRGEMIRHPKLVDVSLTDLGETGFVGTGASDGEGHGVTLGSSLDWSPSWSILSSVVSIGTTCTGCTLSVGGGVGTIGSGAAEIK